MNDAPGKGFLFVSGILLIIFGAIGVLVGFFWQTLIGSLGFGISIGALVSLADNAFMLVAGIMGIKFANDLTKAPTLFIVGCVLLGLKVLNIVVGIGGDRFGFQTIISLAFIVLPVLYFLGAMKNKAAFESK
jgi:hypothetical protein